LHKATLTNETTIIYSDQPMTAPNAIP